MSDSERGSMARNLIIFYSRRGFNYSCGEVKFLEKGNTEIAVNFMKRVMADVDVFEITPVKQYSDDYYKCTEEAKIEYKNNSRPELKQYLDNIDGYERVFICGPCWWGTYPMAVFSQLERLKWKGKQVYFLVTHEGSKLGNCERDLTKVCKGAVIHPGFATYGTGIEDSEDNIVKWCREALLVK